VAIKPFFSIPQNIREWTNFWKETTVSPSDATIGDSAFVPRAALSIIGRSTNTDGTPADIIAAGNGQFLGRRANVVGFVALEEADIPSTIARDTEVTAAVAAHVAAVDPHPGYLTPAEGNAAYQPLTAALSFIFRGAGDPEGVVMAAQGSLFLRTDGGAGTTVYAKNSGAGNTGWGALS
jgi:hypothetical protein